MTDEELKRQIDDYVERVWPDVVEDIGSLVAIPSVEDRDHAEPGKPFGPEPRRALDCALAIAARAGLETHCLDGYIGYADLKGASDRQIATIAHTDVVPMGTGWTVDPLVVTRRDGYLLGRGVLDDKGPFVLSIYAARYFKELGVVQPYTIRCLIGNNEETDMEDVEYYLARNEQPAFLFTPDADFPVCCGEKGGFSATFDSGDLSGGVIVDLDGGTVGNAIPGLASAVVRADASGLPPAASVDVEDAGDGTAKLTAHGRGGHASLPGGTVNAIGLLVDYLLANGLCSERERRFLEFEKLIFGSTDGSTLGIDATDDIFEPLTCIGGTVRTRDGHLFQTIDSRYPKSTSGPRIEGALRPLAAGYGVTMSVDKDMVPFYTDPGSEEIRTLVATYNEYAGRADEPFTIGGGTYARHFENAASFGPNDPNESNPGWVGTEHGPDEGVSEEGLRRALKIYILAIARLMRLDLR